MKWSGLAALLTLAVLAIAGCGGGGGGSAQSESSDDAAVAASVPDSGSSESADSDGSSAKSKKDGDNGKQGRKGKDAKSADGKKKGKKRPKRPSSPEAAVEAIEKAGPGEKDRLIKQAALAATGLHGLTLAAVHSAKDGSSTTIVVRKKGACVARPEDDAAIAEQMKAGVPTLKSVRVEVAGTGQTLAAYTGAHCKRPELPEGKGEVVMVHNGHGQTNTRPFTVNSKKWVIEYDNRGPTMSIFIYRNGKAQDEFVAAQRPGVGRQVITLGPGKYKLSVSGAASWTVRVRDGV